MFATPTKRPRNEEAGEDPESVRQGKKKPRPLSLKPFPFRHSKAIPHNQTGSSHSIPTLTPAESSEDENGAPQYFDPSLPRRKSRNNTTLSHLMEFRSPANTNSDLEMADSQPTSSTMLPIYSAGLSPSCSQKLTPSPISSRLINQSLNVSGGRTATPIYSHFTANMNSDEMMGNDNPIPMSFCSEPPTATNSMQPDRKDPRRHRRLPSPISEDEIPYTTSDATDGTNAPIINENGFRSLTKYGRGGPGGVTLQDSLANEVSTQSWVTHNRNGYDNAARALDIDENELSQNTQKMRRKKVSIAMGFRADCDKCQRRVPGHYSHIVHV